MIPLPVNPIVVMQVAPDSGKVVAVATNVAPDLTVVVVENDADFKEQALGKPFNLGTPVPSLR